MHIAIQQGIIGEQPNQTVINTAGKQGRDDSIKLFSIQPHPTYLFPYIPFICRVELYTAVGCDSINLTALLPDSII